MRQLLFWRKRCTCADPHAAPVVTAWRCQHGVTRRFDPRGGSHRAKWFGVGE